MDIVTFTTLVSALTVVIGVVVAMVQLRNLRQVGTEPVPAHIAHTRWKPTRR